MGIRWKNVARQRKDTRDPCRPAKGKGTRKGKKNVACPASGVPREICHSGRLEGCSGWVFRSLAGSSIHPSVLVDMCTPGTLLATVHITKL